MAEVGPPRRRPSSCTATSTSSPAAEQFEPRVEGDRLFGRGAYDMKGALAVMLLVLHDLREQEDVRLRLGIVSDEESEEEENRGSDALVEDGFIGDFAITGEPTNLQVGVQAKGVLAMRLEVRGRSAHGATPWLGDNAVVKAVEVFRASNRYRLRGRAPPSSTALDQPRSDLGRRRPQQSARHLRHRRRHPLPARPGPRGDPRAGRRAAGHAGAHDLPAPARGGRADSPFVRGLCEAASPHHPERVMSVGRDGASDAVSFLAVGVPAVEFGPIGDGHHGPEEWVSISSLRSYRQALEASSRLPGMVPA